jgi:hypothetical protein
MSSGARRNEGTMSRLLAGAIGLFAGYFAGAALTGVAVELLSTNTHDKDLEVVMTAFFAGGPVGALLGVVAGLLWRRSRTKIGA